MKAEKTVPMTSIHIISTDNRTNGQKPEIAHSFNYLRSMVSDESGQDLKRQYCRETKETKVRLFSSEQFTSTRDVTSSAPHTAEGNGNATRNR